MKRVDERARAGDACGAPRAAGSGTAGSSAAAPAAPILEARGLAVGHGARPLVRGVDLTVAPGQVVALIGPNGSGKTTLLRTIAGQLAPLSGTLRIAGRDAAALAAAERARICAALFTERPRGDLLTCQDIVEAGRYPFTGRMGALSDEDRAQVRAAMRAAGVWELRDRDFAHMSDGQRQRALIARALCQEPRLLILDEPTSYLDIRAQLDMLQLLRRRARERGMAVIMSLHEIELAQKAADWVACIRDGRALCQGTPDEIFRAPTIARLFDLGERSYSPLFGSVELGATEGAPRVFVLAGAGAGARTFRELARRGVPFASGVLFAHDADGILARALAARAVLAPDFEPIGAGALAEAHALIDGCEAVICCADGFPGAAAPNAGLLEHARAQGIPVFDSAAAYLERRATGSACATPRS